MIALLLSLFGLLRRVYWNGWTTGYAKAVENRPTCLCQQAKEVANG